MIDDQLAGAVAAALKKAQQRNKLPPFDLPTSIPVERPKQAGMGDFATPICLQLARYARMAPIQIAEIVADILRERHVDNLPFLASVEIAHPGFINFRLDEGWLQEQVPVILAAPDTFGDVDLGQGARVQVEYVSANPTGPLHMGSARNAVLGDALASTLEAAGYTVQREYYVNDAGSRVQVFGETLLARYAQALGHEAKLPEEGYHGQYMIELGQQIAAEHGERFLQMPREEAVPALGRLGIEAVIADARADLALLGIEYDGWFSEQSLYDRRLNETIMTMLRQGDYLYVHEGAVWFRATALGGDKDEVVIRSNGTPGYFASDIAYHYEKFVERGFDRVIDVWGADHQGHVPRMKAMMRALDLDPERLTIIIYQLVTLKRGGEIVRLSKRTGDMITLREVLDEVGADAMRYFLLSRSADSQMDFDIDLAKEQSDENPVYYVQYAHARICSILRHGQEVLGGALGAGDDASGLTPTDVDLSLLTSKAELDLIRQMLRLPETVRLAAIQLAPHHLTYYAYELAQAFHAFYRDCRVVSNEPGEAEITRARIALVTACRAVLARVLGLMGMSAPETM